MHDLGQIHMSFLNHQPNREWGDDTSVCFPGLLWDLIRRNLGTGKLLWKDECAVQAGGDAS